MEPGTIPGKKFKLNMAISGMALLFAIANYFLVREGYYTGFMLPVVIIVFFLIISSLEKAWILAVIVTPFSVFLNFEGLGSRISFPGEFLLAIISLGIILNLILHFRFDKNFMHHPVTFWILAGLTWLAITTLTSEMPMVSFKYMVSKLWFILPMYFAGSCFFINKKSVRLFIWAHSVSLLAIVTYTTYRHSLFGFSERSGHWVMDPFYNDHTAYGAVLALSIPLMMALLLDKELKPQLRLAAGFMTMAFTAGLLLSASRAAWISIVAAILIFLVIRLRIRITRLAILAGIMVMILLVSRESLFTVTGKNQKTASRDLVMHIQSIANVTTDASNMERINRWKSALRMYSERPVFGWGPGTYQFVYAPYQLAREKTIISTDFGEVGSVHSEYLEPLTESGLPGFILFSVFAIALVYRGIKIYSSSSPGFVRNYSLAVTLALITYFVHGFMNNFLETDKLSVPFWALAAIIVVLDYRAGNFKEYTKGNQVSYRSD